MIMTAKLADSLMENLMCLAISANGGVPKNGITEKQMNLVQQYAESKFFELLEEWTNLFDKEWQITEEDEVN